MFGLSKRIEAYLYQKALDGYARSLPDIFLKKDASVTKDSIEFRMYVRIIKDYVSLLKKIEAEHSITQKVQELRMRAILAIAIQIPWWREHFKKCGIDPLTVRSVAEFGKIKPVDRYNFIDIPKSDLLTVAEEDPAIIWRGSSGSTTGTPFIWGLNKTLLIVDVLANFVRQMEDRGFSFEDTMFEDFHLHLNMFMDSNRHAFKWFSMNDLSVRRYDEDLDEKILELNRLLRSVSEPVVLTSPGDLPFLAEAFKERGLQPRIRFFMTVGSPLYDSQRRPAAEYFGATIFSFYGAQEMGPCAIECKKRNGLYHAFVDRIIFEIVDQDGNSLPPGVEGLITITCLDNTFMPLIRYQPGDIAILRESGSCGCGSITPLFEIQSRTTDVIRFSDGRSMSVSALLRSFSRPEYNPYVRKFQVRQDAVDMVKILLEVRETLPEETIRKLKDRISQIYGTNLIPEIEQVAAIKSDSPKFKVFTPLKN